MNFLTDTRALATTFMSIVVAMMALASAALVIEHVNITGQRDLLKSAADAGAIAATQKMARVLRDNPAISDEDLLKALNERARAYIELNISGNLQGDRGKRAMDTLAVTVEADRDAGTVGVTAEADLGGFLVAPQLGFLSGVGDLDSITVKSGVQAERSPVEVVLAIDTSRSMDLLLRGTSPSGGHRDSRMEIAKRAARALVATLNPNAQNRVAVGVVPWHIMVRLDWDRVDAWTLQRWVDYPGSRRYAAAYTCAPEGQCRSSSVDQALPADPGGEWRGCLDEHRVLSGRLANLPPVSDLLNLPSDRPFAQGIFNSLGGVAYQCLAAPLPANFSKQLCYDAATATSGGQHHIAPQFYCHSQTGATAPMLPLTTNRAAIRRAIDNLRPVGLSTYSTLGVLWGQRMLSHGWRHVWGSGDHPVDPHDEANEGTRKAIVLLTDGADNQCGNSDPDCSASDVGIARNTACTLAKNRGTEIFVVAAMHPEQVSGDLGAGLRACSSEADNPEGSYVFLNNADPADLEAAFADIADQLVTIRRFY